MKLKALSFVAALLFLLTVVILGLNQAYVRAGAQVDVKGIPERGLELLSRGDPSFDHLVVAALKGTRPPEYTLFEPFAVVLRNTTNGYVVGYAIRWEFTEASGRRVHWDITFSQPSFLLDGGLRRRDPVSARTGWLVAPHSLRVITPELNLGPDSEIPQWPADQRHTAYLSDRAARLAGGSDLRISLDGAFFDDGTFVGENRSGYFEHFKAEVDTKQELLDEVLRAVSSGKRVGQVVDELQAGLPPSDPGLSEALAPATFSKHYRRRHVEQLISIRKAKGDDGVIAHVRGESYRFPPNLRKAEQ